MIPITDAVIYGLAGIGVFGVFQTVLDHASDLIENIVQKKLDHVEHLVALQIHKEAEA